MWPFKKKPAEPIDMRDWSDGWKVGDTAECVVQFDAWHDTVKPWNRPKFGQRFKVIGYCEGVGGQGESLEYFLRLEGCPKALSTRGFRKVIPVSKTAKRKAEKSNPITSDPQWWLDQEPAKEDA